MNFLFLLIVAFFPSTALAAGPTNAYLTTIFSDVCNIIPCGNTSVVVVVSSIVVNAVLAMIGSAAVVIILYASVRLITSGGNDETVRKAWKEMIFYALLGLLFAVLADVLVNYVFSLASDIASV